MKKLINMKKLNIYLERYIYEEALNAYQKTNNLLLKSYKINGNHVKFV